MNKHNRYELEYRNWRGFWVHVGTYILKRHALAASKEIRHRWRIIKWTSDGKQVAQGGES